MFDSPWFGPIKIQFLPFGHNWLQARITCVRAENSPFSERYILYRLRLNWWYWRPSAIIWKQFKRSISHLNSEIVLALFRCSIHALQDPHQFLLIKILCFNYLNGFWAIRRVVRHGMRPWTNIVGELIFDESSHKTKSYNFALKTWNIKFLGKKKFSYLRVLI